MDRGQVEDWFGSNFIVAFAVISGVAFLLMIPWEATRSNPLVDLRMLATRQFGSCFLVMLATGAILLATTNFMPQLVQEDFGYTATWAGLVAPRPTQISDCRGRGDLLPLDVWPDQYHPGSRFLVLRQLAHAAQRRAAADLHPDLGRVI
jgi:hypothetical protein